MTQPARKIERLVWAGVAVLIALVMLVFLVAAIKVRTAAGKPLPVEGSIEDFTLTNENGRAVSLADLRGRVWLVDIIFTRCPGQCIRMTSEMKQIQQALSADSRVRLVSLTTDPDFDTPPVLRAYAEKFGADTNRWTFLTGTKRQLANLAVDSLKMTVIEKKPGERDSPDDLFVHSTLFELVDRNGQLRGQFQAAGEDVDFDKVKPEILAAIRRLERER